MRTRRVLIFLLSVVLLASCSSREETTYSLPYEMPFEEWKRLPSSKREALLKMPQEFLESAPTSVLLEKVLEHPSMVGRTAFDNPLDAYEDYIHNRINGIQALIEREDFIDCLIDLYKESPIDAQHRFFQGNLEYLLVVAEHIVGYSDEEIEEIIEIQKENIPKKRECKPYQWDDFSQYAFRAHSKLIDYIDYDYALDEYPYQFLIEYFP